jgi:hypothetical protein
VCFSFCNFDRALECITDVMLMTVLSINLLGLKPHALVLPGLHNIATTVSNSQRWVSGIISSSVRLEKTPLLN